jgi:electron transfer flavoprotein alpha/beta subunit
MEKVTCPLPAVVAVKGDGKLPYASLDCLIESKYAPVTLLSRAELSISPADLKIDPSPAAGLVFPRPAPRRAPPLDSSLPAFNRILQLLEGGIAKRKVRMLKGSNEELVEQLFQLLKDEGVLRPAVD